MCVVLAKPTRKRTGYKIVLKVEKEGKTVYLSPSTGVEIKPGKVEDHFKKIIKDTEKIRHITKWSTVIDWSFDGTPHKSNYYREDYLGYSSAFITLEECKRYMGDKNDKECIVKVIFNDNVFNSYFDNERFYHLISGKFFKFVEEVKS